MDKQFKEYYVAVDGGGSGTRARAYQSNGVLIGTGVAGASSLTLGVEQSWKHIRLAITSATTNSQYDGFLPTKILVGVAGSRNDAQRKAFLTHATKFAKSLSIVVMSDAYSSALGALGNRPGVVLSIGTGVAACAIDQDLQPHYMSGWGFKVGDEGAGSWLGLKAVQGYLHYYDKRLNKQSSLFDLMSREVGADIASIQHWCLNATATDFAMFARPIAEMANDGDSFCMELMQAAAFEVEQVINTFSKKSLAPYGGPIVIIGGLGLALIPYIDKKIVENLKKPQGSALDGLALLLFSDVNTTDGKDAGGGVNACL